MPYSAIDPATEYLSAEEEAVAPELGDGTQIWRITHDGTVSHSVTFGGFDVQVLSRARREGAVRPPDPGELGWKDTLRVDPLESVLVAMRPVLAGVPFALPASERALDITRPLGAEGPFTQLDQLTAEPLQPEVVNGRPTSASRRAGASTSSAARRATPRGRSCCRGRRRRRRT